MLLQKFAGYLSVGIVAFLTGYIANHYGVRPYPFYLGIGISIAGFLLTLFFVKDTRVFVQQENTTNTTEKLENIFKAAQHYFSGFFLVTTTKYLFIVVSII